MVCAFQSLEWTNTVKLTGETNFEKVTDLSISGVTGKNEHGIMMNPMKDLFQSSRFDKAHGEFAAAFDKTYRHEADRRKAANNYMQNVRYINSKNRQGLSYKLKVNHMTDMTRAERRKMLGLVRNNDGSWCNLQLTSKL